MLTHIDLICLGAFAVTAGGQPVTKFATDKVRALLAYLALEPGPHRREALAGLLWPDDAQDLALHSLRSALHRLRQTLEQAAPGAGDALFTITRQTVEVNPAALACDAVTFLNLIAECDLHAHANLAGCAECLDRLRRAVALYHGELLAGFELGDAPTFEEWLLVRREILHQHTLLSLQALVDAYEQRGDLDRALGYAHQQLALDPYREEAQRQTMRLLARLGRTQQALAQYETCRRLLREELGAEPDDNATALYEQIRAGEFRIENAQLRE